MKGADAGAMSVFVEWAEDVCMEDGALEPLCKDGGHMCVAKIPDAGKPENPWVLVALKLYA